MKNDAVTYLTERTRTYILKAVTVKAKYLYRVDPQRNKKKPWKIPRLIHSFSCCKTQLHKNAR